MNWFFETLQKFKWAFKGIKTYALVGKSGTGKSFRAQLVAKRFGINYIIDDGLIIYKDQIIGGSSAKREKNTVAAVKRAIFEDSEHRILVQKIIQKRQVRKILIIGTSKKMVCTISRQLRIPDPFKIISITDIASLDEIKIASHSRNIEGKHIIPVPRVEVDKKHSSIVLDSIKILVKNPFLLFRKKEVVEKTLVRPTYSKKGDISLTREALVQMVLHCILEYNKDISVKKINFKLHSGDVVIDVNLSFPFGLNIPVTLMELQNFIMLSIEQYTGLHIEKVNFHIQKIGNTKK